MFSGIQEILVLVAIILGILFLPRILNRGQAGQPAAARPARPALAAAPFNIERLVISLPICLLPTFICNNVCCEPAA